MIPWHVFIFLSLAHAEINLGSVQNSSVQSTDSIPTEATNATELTPCHLSGSAASYCECSNPGEHIEQNLLMIKCFIDQKFENETILDVYSDASNYHQGQGFRILSYFSSYNSHDLLRNPWKAFHLTNLIYLLYDPLGEIQNKPKFCQWSIVKLGRFSEEYLDFDETSMSKRVI